MRELPTTDRLYGKGVIRADGRKIHDMYLFEVKTPTESKYLVILINCAPLFRQPKPFVH